jgi:hypothetical protein
MTCTSGALRIGAAVPVNADRDDDPEYFVQM